MTARRGWAVVALSVLALTLVWRFLPEGSPPIYDGQCIADPYVTLSSNPPAKGVTKTFPKAASFPPEGVNTNEVPPQAQILIEQGTFVNSTPVTITITPVATPATKPKNGTIQGNVYQFTAVNPSGTELEPLSTPLAVFVILRALTSVPAPVIDRWNGSTWTPLSTFNAGCGNTFEASSVQMGEFAAVEPGGSGTSPPASSGGIPGSAVIGTLAVLLIIAIVVLFVLERRRNAAH